MDKWVKLHFLGAGTYGTVSLAAPLCNVYPSSVPLIAVKSSPLGKSASLMAEAQALQQLRGCQEIIHCYGEDVSVEDGGLKIYNLLLEYAPDGNLGELIMKRGKLPESEAAWYSFLMLKGLFHIHKRGFVHCDVKPDNVLVVPSECGSDFHGIKIADFGLVKRAENWKLCWKGRLRNNRGTLFYSSPESLQFGLHEAPMDIWSFGCIVSEMISGKPAWSYRNDLDLLSKIAFGGNHLPEIPEGMSELGKDFLRRCFERDPRKRWTAEMLLRHPFIVHNCKPNNNGSSCNNTPSNGWIQEMNMFTAATPTPLMSNNRLSSNPASRMISSYRLFA